MKKLIITMVGWALVLGAISNNGFGQQDKENHVIMGPDYEKGQQSERPLLFVVPPDWVRDEKGARKTGMYSVLVPRGMNLENADRVITIAFQKKSNKPGMGDLKSFVGGTCRKLLRNFRTHTSRNGNVRSSIRVSSIS